MKTVSTCHQHCFELAFKSSYAIVKLSGLEGSEQLLGLRKEVIAGNLSFDEAVQVVLAGAQSDSHE